MEEDKVINYDDSIVTEINNKDFKLSINASNFSNEYYTVDYINSIFSALRNCCDTCDNAINNIKVYFNKQSEVENIKQPDLINIDFLLEGNLDTTINDKTEENKILEKSKEKNNLSFFGGSIAGSSSHNGFTQDTVSNDKSVSVIDGTKLIHGKVKLREDLKYVNVFSSSDNSSNVSALIANGAEIKIIGEENNMYKIIFGEKFDNVGYIPKDYIEINNNNNISTEIISTQVLTNDNSYLRIYSTSDINGIAKNNLLGNGANIKIISEENNMYKILYGETFDKIGYISKNYVNK